MTFSGDGGHAGIPTYGGCAKWLRWDPSNPLIIDYWYPRRGIAGRDMQVCT